VNPDRPNSLGECGGAYDIDEEEEAFLAAWPMIATKQQASEDPGAHDFDFTWSKKMNANVTTNAKDYGHELHRPLSGPEPSRRKPGSANSARQSPTHRPTL